MTSPIAHAVRALLLAVLLQCMLFRCEASTPYTSVRALDEFGNSVQLRHAREAAVRYGRPIVAAYSHVDDAVVVVSMGDRPVAQTVTIPCGDADPVVLCCTGIKGDATWLLHQVRDHAKQIWERYDHHIDASAVSYLVARLHGGMFGDDPKKEWQSSVEREKLAWARPLGIQTLIVSPHSPILTVEPSGRVLVNFVASDAGAGQDTANDSFGCVGRDCALLTDKLRRDKATTTIGGLATPELRQHLLDMLCSSLEPKDGTRLQIEIVSSNGIDRDVAVWRNGAIVNE